MKITEKTTLKKILEQKGAEEILKKYNLPCLTCPMASSEIGFLKLGEVAEMYDLALDDILEELNKEGRVN